MAYVKVKDRIKPEEQTPFITKFLRPATKEDINKGIYRFITPEEADELVMSKIAQFAKKGGKTSTSIKWTEGELQMRHSVILEYICNQGLSREATAKQISDRWNVGLNTARRYVKEAVESLTRDFEDYKEEVRKVHLERLESIMQTALENGREDLALKALEQMGKVNGLFEQKVDLTAKNTTDIHFDFS